MASRERFLAQLKGEPVDKPFLWESGIWISAVERWHNEGLNKNDDPYEILGLERLAFIGLNHEMTPSLRETVLEENEESVLIEDEAGGRYRRSKTLVIPGNGDPLGDYEVYPLRDRNSWEIIKKHLDSKSEERKTAYAAFAEGRNCGIAGSNTGFSQNYDPDDGLGTILYILTASYWLVRIAGLEKTAFMFYDDRLLMEEIYEYYTQFLADQLKDLLSKRVPDAVVLNEGSAASKHGPFMSPDDYRLLTGTPLRRLVELCQEAEVPFIFANSGGNISSLIPLWKNIGINGLIPLEAHMDIAAICRDYPDMALIGGIDRQILERTSGEIESHVRERTAVLWAHGRAIPSADAHYPISDRVSLKNMQLYIELLKDGAQSLKLI